MNLKSLIGKLNDSTRGALEASAGLCLTRTNYDIEIEHYLLKLLDSVENDAASIFSHFEIDTSRFRGELTRSLDKLKSGNARTPALSPTLIKMMTEAWTLGSIDYGAGQIRTGFTILALVTNDELARLMRDVSREFQKIQADALRKDFASIVANSSEEAQTDGGHGPGRTRAPQARQPNQAARLLTWTSSRSTSLKKPRPGRLIRCWAGTRRFDRLSISSCGAGRITPS